MTDAKPIYGPGEIATVRFADGEPVVSFDCDDCDCPDHDFERDYPKLAGTYVEVRLDNDGASVGLGRVVLLTEQEYSDLRAAAWDEGKTAGLRQSDWEHGDTAEMYVATNPYRKEARDV